MTTPSSGKDLEQLKFSSTVDRSVKLERYFDPAIPLLSVYPGDKTAEFLTKICP